MAVSADRPEELRRTLRKHDLDYTLLSDARMEASRAFGIAFRVDDATFAQYRDYGIDLEAASGETHHLLPVPSVFIVDSQGVIRFGYSNPDYKVRIPIEELMAEARAVAEGR